MELKLAGLTFEEAVNFFKDKVPLTPKQFSTLYAEYKSLAFTVSGIGSLDVLHDMHKEVLKALEEGTTAQKFGENLNKILERKGWEGLTPFRLDNIFRTNIQTAYMIGHHRRMTDPDVVKHRPYWMYDAVNDRHTRPTHRALDGMVFPHDHPFWDRWYPPNGYRCRCGVISLSKEQVAKRGLKVADEIPDMVEPPGQLARPLMPDPGFDHNPAKAKWQPDLSKYPESLQKAYYDRNAQKAP